MQSQTSTTLNMVFSVTYCLESCNATVVYCTSHFLNDKRSNMLFESYRTLTSLLGEKYYIHIEKDIGMCNSK